MVGLKAAQRELLKLNKRKCPERHPKGPFTSRLVRSNAKYSRTIAERCCIFVIVGYQVDFISDCGVLTDTAFKFATEGLAEQHDRHPAIARKMKLQVIFERGTERSLRTAWGRGIGADLRAYGVKIGVAQGHPEKSADLPNAVRLAADHDKSGRHVLAQAYTDDRAGNGRNLTDVCGIGERH